MVKPRYMVTVALDEETIKDYEKLRKKGVKSIDIIKKGIDKAMAEKEAEKKQTGKNS